MSAEPTPEGLAMDGGIYDRHSWRPQNIIELAANPPAPPTIGGLLYPAKRTLVSGETESLKTFLALILCKAEMDTGYSVAWADLDAMGAGEIVSRLLALGVDEKTVAQQFLYYEPTEALKQSRLDDVCLLLRERAVRLFVIDAFNSMLNLHGLDPSSTPDVETFWREVATPITETGAAPTLIDHVVKNADHRSKYSYGSERKASGAIVHIGLQIIKAFSRGGTGRTLLTTHKDRPGYLPRPTIGRLVLISDADLIRYELEADLSRTGDKFRPTVLMERVSRKLETLLEQVSRTWVENHVQGNAAGLRTAIDVLVDEGYVREETTSQGSRLTSVRPYREAEDDVLRHEDETPSQPRPNPVPSLVSVPTDPTPSPRPLRKQDGDGGRSGTASPNSVPSSSPVNAGVGVGRNGRLLAPGDPGFPLHVDISHQNGHLTELEHEQRLALHHLIGKTLLRIEEPPPWTDAEAADVLAQQDEVA